MFTLIPKRLISFSASILFCLTIAENAMSQSFQYPPYGAHRGRMVSRNGIGHVTRYRWGNGLTPTGGAVLTHAIDAFAPVLMTVAGNPTDGNRSREETSARARDRQANWADYVKAQNEANNLLRRTASLLDPSFGVSTTPQDQPQNNNVPALTPQGNNPWTNAPGGNNQQGGNTQNGTVPTLEPKGDNPWNNADSN